jgi:MFS family permease
VSDPREAIGGGASLCRRLERVWPIFVCESLSSVGTTLLTMGIFFYMRERFGWGMGRNFALAAGEGAGYVLGSLSADRVAARIGRRGLLIACLAISAALAMCALLTSSPIVLAALLVAYTLFMAMTWPAVESLATTGVAPAAMSRRVGVYNLIWSGTNTLAFVCTGSIIAHAPQALFLLPAGVHLVEVFLAAIFLTDAKPQAAADGSPVGEDELRRMRKLALWLSRICLPSTYVVNYALMAMMPSLLVIEKHSQTARTWIAGTWMIARWIMFVWLGATMWWHTRPRILLICGVLMLISFVAVPLSLNVQLMLAAQIVLGMSIGWIYAASLYFGMVLSDGATEHGGYHEALIGLGLVLGPGVGAASQFLSPGNTNASVAAVAALVVVSLAAAIVAAKRVSG